MTDPCFGIVCNSPPSCKASPGVCSAGICNYGNAAANGTSCQGGSGTCQGGTCMGICSPNPCTNTTECYTNPGTCMPMPDAGLTCTYNPKSYGAQCSIGYCNGNGTCMDACNPNPCNMPPGDCNVMQGTCTLGGDGGPSCAYPFKSNGATCSMGFCNGTGTCVNPCMPNPCNSPPGQCFMGPGMCTAGDGGALCSYFPKPNMTPCTGGACDNNGVCIPMDAGTQ